MCLKKNIVYKITCTLYKDTYIGETSRTIKTRIHEHTHKKFKYGAYRHFIKKQRS